MTAIPPRRSRQHIEPDIAEDDRYYEQPRYSTAVRRYQQPRHTSVVPRDTEAGPLLRPGPATQRVDAYGRPVVRQGNRAFVMVTDTPKRRRHWAASGSLFVVLMVIGWIVLNTFGTWWTNWRNYTDYGYPRTYQTDAVVGHSDSPTHPSHFIFMNLRGQVVVVEFPGGNVAHTIVYKGAMLLGPEPSYLPVTGRFYDATGTGRLDMEIDYDNVSQIWRNDGTKFVPPGS